MYELTGKWKTGSKYTGENAHLDEKYVDTEVKLTNLSVWKDYCIIVLNDYTTYMVLF